MAEGVAAVEEPRKVVVLEVGGAVGTGEVHLHFLLLSVSNYNISR